MAFNVRVFGFRGVQELTKVNPKQFSSDAIHQLVHPYEWRETLVAGAAAVSSAAQGQTDQTTLLRVEVPDGQAIRYEINPPTRSGGLVSAGVNSPKLSGINHFFFGAGWTISIIDASTVAA